MADDMNTQSLCTDREHYTTEDSVLAHVEIPDPCDIRIDITTDRVALTIGNRDFGWKRHHPDTTDSGTFLGDVQYGEAPPQISGSEVRGIIAGAQGVIEGRTKSFAEIQGELKRKPIPPMTTKPAQSDAPSARTVQGSLGGTFYISPDGNFLIWDTKPPTEADDAHRGLLIALDKSEAKVAQLERERDADKAVSKAYQEGIVKALKLPEDEPVNLIWAAQEIVKRAEAAESALSEARERTQQLEAKLNTPELNNFGAGVILEAVHQRERWGSDQDAGKTSADWYWLIGYLAGKALFSFNAGDLEKTKHHIITTAAALNNWHAQILEASNMRPGLSEEKQSEIERATSSASGAAGKGR